MAKKTYYRATKYSILIARLDERTGGTLHQLVAGTNDLKLFNNTDLKPFVEAFKNNDIEYDSSPIVKELSKRKK